MEQQNNELFDMDSDESIINVLTNMNYNSVHSFQHTNNNSTDKFQITIEPSDDKSNYEDNLMLKKLLTDWKLEIVYQRCLDQEIDVETLQYIQNHHIPMLLKGFKLGVMIRFEHYVKKYQNLSNNNSDIPEINPKITTTNELPCTSVQPEAFEKKKETIELVQMLSNNTQGSLIFDYFKNHNMLNDSCRNLLIEIIISDLVKKDLTMTIKLANYIADAIVTVFPSEIKDVYFIKDSINKSPKGKLYSKYFNTVRTMKQNGLIPIVHKEPSKLKTKVSRTMDVLNNSFEIEPESEQYSSYLSDKDMTWPEIEEIWRKTINYRLHFLKNNNPTEIFNKWQHYKKPMGYKLIDIDFLRIHTNCNNFGMAFENSSSKLIYILNLRVKDSGSKKLLETLKNTTNISDNSKTLIIMYLLHSIFIPTSRKVTLDDNGKKSYTKYSIKDSQHTFIKICDTSAEMEALIVKLGQKGAIPPCILVIGSLNDPKQILVYFDNIKYVVFSSSKAFDICFKIYHVFNIEYPIESIDVWQFIQTFFYNIHTKYDKTSSLLKQVTAELNH